MNTTARPWILAVSVPLILPAIVLAVCGLLYGAFRFEPANRFIDSALSRPWGAIVFSPVVLLGGLVLAIGLNLSRTCRLRLRSEAETVAISLSIARPVSHLMMGAVGLGVLGTLLCYAVGENFAIVPR